MPAATIALLVIPALAGATLVSAPGSPHTVGTNPLGIGVADFDGDGVLDLVTANGGSQDVSLLLGDGSGGFDEAPGSPFDPEHQSQTLHVADLNGDGNPDVVTTTTGVSGFSTGTASVLLGDGAGGLATSSCSPFGVSFSPEDVASGDFDEDGHQDLAVPNSFLSLGVDIELGDGSGCFTEHSGSPFAAGTIPRSVVAADFDEDGHLDLAVANQGSRDVSLLLGDGTGSFAAAPGSPFALGRFGQETAIGDFNEDGHVDLAVSNFTFFSVTVLLGDGQGGLTNAAGSPFSVGALTQALGLAVGDVDADGHQDIATAAINEDTVVVHLGTGTGSFLAAPGSPFAVGDSPRAVVAADLDGDSRDDLALANALSGTVSVLLSVPDTDPPTVACSPPSQLAWYGANVSVACTASDSASGLASPGDASFSLSTTVATGDETSSAATGSRQVCDRAGNCTTAGPFVFKVDLEGPTVSCLGTPTFVLRQAAAHVSAAVTDDGSGPSSSPVTGAAATSVVGSGTADVTGADVVGNTTTVACAFTVVYAFDGFFSPLKNPPQVNSATVGRTFAMRWQLQDAAGAYISHLGVLVRSVAKPSVCPAFSTDPTGAPPAASRGPLSYETATSSYNFRWATSRLDPGCYTLMLELDSGQLLRAYFDLR